jgi:hypothetical protein
MVTSWKWLVKNTNKIKTPGSIQKGMERGLKRDPRSISLYTTNCSESLPTQEVNETIRQMAHAGQDKLRWSL